MSNQSLSWASINIPQKPKPIKNKPWFFIVSIYFTIDVSHNYNDYGTIVKNTVLPTHFHNINLEYDFAFYHDDNCVRFNIFTDDYFKYLSNQEQYLYSLFTEFYNFTNIEHIHIRDMGQNSNTEYSLWNNPKFT